MSHEYKEKKHRRFLKKPMVKSKKQREEEKSIIEHAREKSGLMKKKKKTKKTPNYDKEMEGMSTREKFVFLRKMRKERAAAAAAETKPKEAAPTDPKPKETPPVKIEDNEKATRIIKGLTNSTRKSTRARYRASMASRRKKPVKVEQSSSDMYAEYMKAKAERKAKAEAARKAEAKRKK